MKRMITASNSTQLPISKLTEDELQALPEKVLLRTDVPGTTEPVTVFRVVKKDKILDDPERCCIIDSYWGYAHANETYLASKSDVEQYKKIQIEEINNKANTYMRYAL